MDTLLSKKFLRKVKLPPRDLVLVSTGEVLSAGSFNNWVQYRYEYSDGTSRELVFAHNDIRHNGDVSKKAKGSRIGLVKFDGGRVGGRVAMVDPLREAKSTLIRTEIADLEAKLEALKTQLYEPYVVEVEEPRQKYWEKDEDSN